MFMFIKITAEVVTIFIYKLNTINWINNNKWIQQNNKLNTKWK